MEGTNNGEQKTGNQGDGSQQVNGSDRNVGTGGTGQNNSGGQRNQNQDDQSGPDANDVGGRSVITEIEDPARLADSEERPNQHSQGQRLQPVRYDPPEEPEPPARNHQMSSGGSGMKVQHGVSQSYPNERGSPIGDRSEMGQFAEVEASLQQAMIANDTLRSINEGFRSLNVSLMVALNVLCSGYGQKDWVFEGCQSILKNAHDDEGSLLQDPESIYDLAMRGHEMVEALKRGVSGKNLQEQVRRMMGDLNDQMFKDTFGNIIGCMDNLPSNGRDRSQSQSQNQSQPRHQQQRPQEPAEAGEFKQLLRQLQESSTQFYYLMFPHLEPKTDTVIKRKKSEKDQAGKGKKQAAWDKTAKVLEACEHQSENIKQLTDKIGAILDSNPDIGNPNATQESLKKIEGSMEKFGLCGLDVDYRNKVDELLGICGKIPEFSDKISAMATKLDPVTIIPEGLDAQWVDVLKRIAAMDNQ